MKTPKTAKNATTVALKGMLKKYDTFYFHGARELDAPEYSDPFIFTMTAAFNNYGPNKREEKSTLDIRGDVRGGHTDTIRMVESTLGGKPWPRADEGYRPRRGFWSLYCGEELLRSAMASIPDDAEVSLSVYLDAGTNQYLLMANPVLHGDHLYLHAEWKRGSKQYKRKFLIDTTTSAHNSARFGRGSEDR